MQRRPGQRSHGHYLECLLCLKMADKEQTNDEMFEDKTDMFQRNKALLEAYLKGKVPCPYRSCSKEKEQFYKPGEGLKIHYRSSHQGQEETKYDESLVNKAAFKSLQERQALDIRQFLENKCEQTLAHGTLGGSCCFTVQYLGLAGMEILNIICDRAETAAKTFGLFLHAKGYLNVYGRGADGTEIEVRSEEEIVNFKIWFSIKKVENVECDSGRAMPMDMIQIVLRPRFVKVLKGIRIRISVSL